MKLHQAFAQALIDLNVETMFGLMGDGNLWMVNSYVNDLSGEYVAATHEANAVLMASGFARLTGRIGVATVTHGPALTNTVTALTDAARGRIPIVLICGDTPVEQRDHSQNIAQREVVMPTGAGFEQVRSVATALDDLHTAFRRARGESRPIVLNVPRDFYLAEVDGPLTLPVLPAPQATRPDPDALDRALGIIASARRPVVLAGRGAIGAHEELVELADRIGAVLATTLQGRDLFASHPYNVGICGTLATDVATKVISESDCVIAFGAGLNRLTTADRGLVEGKALVQCDLRLEAIGRYVPATAAVLGDAATVAQALADALREADISGTGVRSEMLKSQIAEAAEPLAPHPKDASELEVRPALAELSRAIPATRAFVTDLGRFIIDAWQAVSVPRPNAYVHSNNFGSIGLGMGYAIGMTYGAHGPTVLVTGDGGFMLGGVAELSTAVRYQRDLVVIIVNDSAYGAEHVQFRDRGLDPTLTTFSWPDLAELSRALGADACTVKAPADLAGAVCAIQDRRGPLVIDLVVAPEAVLAHGY